MALQVTPEQVKFGRKLAHTEKEIRDGAVTQLGAFLGKQDSMKEVRNRLQLCTSRNL